MQMSRRFETRQTLIYSKGAALLSCLIPGCSETLMSARLGGDPWRRGPSFRGSAIGRS